MNEVRYEEISDFGLDLLLDGPAGISGNNVLCKLFNGFAADV
jgi:hypothetical protein